MAFLDDFLPDIVKEAIDLFETTAQLRRTNSSYVESTDVETQTQTNVSLMCSPPERYKQWEIDGTSIKLGDLWTYIAANDVPFTPDTACQFVFNSIIYSVVRVVPHHSGNLVAAYELQLRR